MLYRHALGDTLRELRTEQHLNLRKVAQNVPMALGYLSEIERGQKEISSEILSDLAKALSVELSELITLVALRLGGGIPDTPEMLLDEYADLMVRS
jgi:transcriptional regulator with XRE-family HTH domain